MVRVASQPLSPSLLRPRLLPTPPPMHKHNNPAPCPHARAVREGTGRIARFELIPLQDLGRPRIDVLCNMRCVCVCTCMHACIGCVRACVQWRPAPALQSASHQGCNAASRPPPPPPRPHPYPCSGIFRDSFQNVVELLDDAFQARSRG